MPIRFHCQQCGASGNANSDLAGQIVNCPSCKALMEIPGPAAIFGEAPEESVGFDLPDSATDEEEAGGFRFTLASMLQLTTMVAACMMVLMPLARPNTGWAAVAGLLVLVGFAVYHMSRLPPRPRAPARAATESTGTGSQGFPYVSAVFLGLGIVWMGTAMVGTIVAGIEEVISPRSYGLGEARRMGFIGLLIGTMIFISALCPILRWLGRDRSA